MANTEVPLCVGCGTAVVAAGEEACPGCRQKYPPALLKACWDDFWYACGLRNGAVISFSSAQICGDWVHLSNSGNCLPIRDGVGCWHRDEEPHVLGLPFPCPRGVDVRLADIVWVADAPRGS